MHISQTMAALHDLQVKAADVLNAYMMAPNREKILTVLGPKFRNDTGKSAIIARALYGLKSACALFYSTSCRMHAGIGVSFM